MRINFAFYANDTTPYNPTIWAWESITLLWEKMVASQLVNRDFSNEIASYGDIVKTRKVAKFVGNRKDPTDNVTVQDAVAVGSSVTLNQLPHVSFRLNDSEMSKSFKDLVPEFLDPAITGLAKMLDLIVIGQFPQFINNSAGRLGNMTGSTVRGDMLELRKVLNDNLVPDENRNLLWNTSSETKGLSSDILIAANQRGDGGNALTRAALGYVLGFQNYMTQHMPSVTATTRVTGAINNASGYSAGAVTFTVDGFSAAIAAGSFITVAGDDTPLRVVSTVGGGTPTSITVVTGLKRAVVDNAVVTVYTPGAVNFASGYAAGWSKPIVIDGASIFPTAGQMISFKNNATGALYMIIRADSGAGTILLDRPLDAAIADNDAVNLGPAGDYNFAFDRDAIMLVNRPLATPLSGTGALSQVVSVNDFSIRATITYDGLSQSHLITVDTLLGIAIRDGARGAVLLG